MRPIAAGTLSILCPIAVAIFSYSSAWGGSADAADRVTWTTGTQFQQRLRQPVDILWSGTPLRRAIRSLSRSQEVAILIDRRADPGQKLDVTIQNMPMESALQTIADRCGLGVARLGAVVYLGPTLAARRLRPAASAFGQAVRQLPPAMQRKFFHSKTLVWDDFSTPRDLLAQLGRQNGVEIAGLEQVPHDLWAAADLPPASLVDRLSLIAVQFDLTFKVAHAGARLELVPMPESLADAAAERAAIPPPPSTPKPSVAAPSASVERIRIQRLLVQDEPLGPVLRQLAARLGLELKIDEKALQAAGVSLDRRVSVKVENATVDELLRQLLKSAGLTFERRQNVVEIRPSM